MLLLLFFNPLNTYDKEKIVYAQVLYKKYKSIGFGIIGICSENENACKDLFKAGNFLFPFVFDKDEEVHRVFDIKKCCGGTILIERKKSIKFRSSMLLNAENLRQLVEKEVTGNIIYDFPVLWNHSIQSITQKLKEMAFLDIQSGEIKYISNLASDDYLVVTFFSSLCPSCKGAVRVETLKKIEKSLLDNKIRAKFMVVFPRPFDEKDINEWQKYFPVPFDKYISFGEIFSEEEKYITNAAKKTDPLTVVMDQKRNIIYVERLGQREEDLQNEIINIISPKGKTT